MPPRITTLPPILRHAVQHHPSPQSLPQTTITPTHHLLPRQRPPSTRLISTLPTFHETTSQPLNELLTRFRTNILLPSTLNRVQRDLVYKQSNHAALLANPLTITIGDEEFVLRPLNRTRDETGVTKLFTGVVGGMQETGEWSLMRPFLSSLVVAKRKLTGEQKAKCVRLMCENGAWAELVGCLMECRYTNLKMEDWVVAREVVYALGKAVVGGDRSKATKFCDQIWKLLYQEKQEAGETRKRIEMLGTVMLVRAVSGDQEEVRRVARTVAKSWPEDWVEYIRKAREVIDDLGQPLNVIVPMARGLRLGSEVLGVETEEGRYVAERATQAEGWVEDELRAVVEATPQGVRPRRGVQLNDELKEVGVPQS